MADIFPFCFSQSTSLDKKTLRCYNVTNRLFSNVEIENTDATSTVNFSEAFLKYTIDSEESITLSWFWCDAIEEIVENYCGEKKSNELRYQVLKLLRQCVQKFIQDECNSKHLGKVKEAKSEAEIQAILAHHLFSQLAPTGKYVIDGRCAPVDLKKCPACKEDLIYGDTSIGNPAYWHGYPDILLDRSTVKVDMNESCCETEETQEYEWPEPDAKRQRLLEQTNGTGGKGSILTLKPDIFTTCEDQLFKTEKALRQSFAQTITNAFYQVKQKPKLQSLCIPSFLASDNKVRIIMYNCEQDRLYISEEMYLFDTLCDHGLNVGTIVSIWLALNFENFQNEVDEEDLTVIALKKSSFQEKLPDTVLSVYKHQLYRPLPKKRKQTEQPPRTTLGVRVLKSKYAKSLLERLESLDSRFFKTPYK
ncbi:uncharacterized protein LOC127720298 [Mytilus californianus]|uniref:uncharacterized protein LOC127720298 n=1 Tax=Mytilus californianus TaxID=6549 RepID=UPI0022457353|nr:uncharacterized protein LOC127720298 [Mytilus californianus]